MKNELIPWWQINFGLKAAAFAAREVSKGHVSMGETTKKFEDTVCEFLGVKYCVATSSGTTALQMALLASNVDYNDVVAIQDRSWIAAAHAAHLLGATIKLIDVEKDLPVLNIEHAEAIIKSRPKVMILIHMNGRSNQLKSIVDKCKEKGIIVIEDGAQAFGSKFEDKFLGTLGDIGCFSLSVTKTLSSGQGGFCVTNSSKLYKKLISMRLHGTADLLTPRWQEFGMNFRFFDIQAAIALNQFSKLKGTIRKQYYIRKKYQDKLAGLSYLRILPLDENKGEVGPYFDVCTKRAKTVITKLKQYGIQSRQFYPSIATAKYLKVLNRNEITNAHYWHKNGLILPSGPSLTDDQIEHISDVLHQVYV